MAMKLHSSRQNGSCSASGGTTSDSCSTTLRESRNQAALLLLTVRKIATVEAAKDFPVIQSSPFPARPRLLLPVDYSREEDDRSSSFTSSSFSWEDSCADPVLVSEVPGATSLRPRTVSMGSVDSPCQVSPIGRATVALFLEPHVKLGNHIAPVPVAPDTLKKNLDGYESRNFVGTNIALTAKARGILKKKFSWKSFPELEQFLVANRLKYLQYSSQLNYTAEQKQYNNSLTQGLLDLAAQEGYVFEEFTFAAVRDRIRCYYKSYVQAIKKKKRKRARR